MKHLPADSLPEPRVKLALLALASLVTIVQRMMTVRRQALSRVDPPPR